MANHEQLDHVVDALGEKILHVLNIYPAISTTMLAIALGSSIPSALWKPELERLVDEGKVVRRQIAVKSLSGRFLTCTILHLEGYEYQLPENTFGEAK